jgi:hypothetical protein
VADEEALFVVVGIDEPAGDFVGIARADFTRLGMEDIDAVNFYLDSAIVCGSDVNVWLTKDDEQVARLGVFERVGPY